MTQPSSTTSKGTRIILGISALVAAAAVGIAISRHVAADENEAAIETGATAPDPVEAISRLEARLKDNPKDAAGWGTLGSAFFENGKLAESATAYARAVQVDPNNAEYWSALGEARVMAGPGDVPSEAKRAFERALEIAPKDPRARYFLGVAQDLSGDHKGAIDAWLALLSDTPEGAPWEQDVRRLIQQVGAKEKIDVASRLSALKQPAPSDGAAIATAAIPGPSRQQMQVAAQMPKGQQDAMIQSMVDGLEAKLKANPRNLQGWIMLMRSRVSLGQTGRATTAYSNARAAFKSDAEALQQLDSAARSLGIR